MSGNGSGLPAIPAACVMSGACPVNVNAIPARTRPPRRSHAEARAEAISQIIDFATQEFVEKGLAGARIDEIAGRSTKRKIYYYFKGKDDLYRAVLERAYRRFLRWRPRLTSRRRAPGTD